jgi:type I restriction enzyme R subunit
VTDLFADPEFDGDPIRVKPVSEDTDLAGIVDEEELNDNPIIDEVSGDEVVMEKPAIRLPPNPFSGNQQDRREKVFVNGVDVSVLISRDMYFDKDGKPITVSLKDHSKNILRRHFTSLDDFLKKWNEAERKETIITELQKEGILVEALYHAVDKKMDLFDLICHVAYDAPPLTRMERANNVRKRNYFSKYGEKARKVLEALLDKYADEGIQNIESMEVLKVKPLTDLGSPTEIIREFGNREKYETAVRELESELYRTA